MDDRKVVWNKSDDLTKLIADLAAQTEKELAAEGITWQYKERQDLHDDVILKLQKELKLAELIRTHRRSRLEYMVHGEPTKSLSESS
jgi:hypothetical protein